MMHGILTRQASTEFGTPGELMLDNGWSCSTLELPWHGNQKGISCIKAGGYRGRIWFSPHFAHNVIRFEDQSGRADVECHNGNFAGDAAQGHFTQVHGCILPGENYTNIAIPDGTGRSQWGIQNSRSTLDRLIAQLGGEELNLTIVWESAAWPEDDT